jgi:glycosyltransferase involved in cell wall biosynthesis
MAPTTLCRLNGMVSLDFACFLSSSGYSQAAQDYMLALNASGHFNLRLSLLHPAPLSAALTNQRQHFFRGLIKKPRDEQAIQIFHCTPQLQRKLKRLSRTVGFATFETIGPPDTWIPILNTNDAVIVPSHFNERLFRSAGVIKPIFHIPHCIDTALYNLDAVPMKSLVNERFRFLFLGTWKTRKGWPQLVEAYWREFSPSDKVSLTIKTDNRGQCQKDLLALRAELGVSEKDVAPVLLETNVFDERRLPSFIKSHDCLVFPTLGEGFGLPPLQCMALGVPVICTNYSGCTDYLSSETATLLEPEGLRMYHMLDQISQFANRPWAYVSVNTIRLAMRSVIANVDEVNRKAMLAAAHVASCFNYSMVAQRFDELIAHFGAD